MEENEALVYSIPNGYEEWRITVDPDLMGASDSEVRINKND